MIEWLLKFLRAPAVERFRAKVPYSVFVSLPWVVLAAILEFGWLIGPVFRGPPKDEILWVLPLFPLAGALLSYLYLSVLAWRGRRSGYRPYVFDWKSLAPAEAPVLMERLVRAAGELRFNVVWQRRDTGFIAVLGIQLETGLASQRGHPGDNFPVRLSFTLSRAAAGLVSARLKLDVRTLVYQDSGETARLGELGEWIVGSAAGKSCPDPQKLAHRAVNPAPVPEAQRYREQFRPLAENYRIQFFRMGVLMVLGLFVLVPLILQVLPSWTMIPLWLGYGVLIMAKFGPRHPDCPRCGKNIGALYGPRCPDCGGELRATDKGQSCSGCGKLLRGGRGRNFRIHACTHCGEYLDERGF